MNSALGSVKKLLKFISNSGSIYYDYSHALAQVAAELESRPAAPVVAEGLTNQNLSAALWSDLKSDADRSNWLLMGRGYATGVVSQSIQNDLAMAYHRLAILAAPAAPTDKKG